MTREDINAIKAQKITAPDMPISMNDASARLNDLAIEWEEHPEHFDDVNPFFIAGHEIRNKSLEWKANEPRVMSLEEAQAALHTERVVWTECEEKNGDKLLYAGLHMDGTDYFTMQDGSVMEETDLDGGMGAELYGKKYRFWTSQPSDELRETTPWGKECSS